jgi:hypothetical protein
MSKQALQKTERYIATLKPSVQLTNDELELLSTWLAILQGDPRSGKPEVHELPEDWESTL